MRRHPVFFAYCFATWWVAMYEPILGANFLWFGTALFLMHGDRQAASLKEKSRGDLHLQAESKMSASDPSPTS